MKFSLYCINMVSDAGWVVQDGCFQNGDNWFTFT